jgi:hypothetical protein
MHEVLFRALYLTGQKGARVKLVFTRLGGLIANEPDKAESRKWGVATVSPHMRSTSNEAS